MPLAILPRTAAAYAPRSPPTVVLNKTIEPWLTQTLKRVNTAAKIKRQLHSVPQHFRCLTDTLAADSAIWHLCSIMLAKAPRATLEKNDDSLAKAVSHYVLEHIQAYVVAVDMVSQDEVAFKLTPESIAALVKYHKDTYSVDAAAGLFDWPEKDAQIEQLHKDFVLAVNSFVFRTDVHALEGMEEGGSGELLEGRSEQAKTAILGMFAPLLPPPPQIVDVLIPSQVYPDVAHVGWWQQGQYLAPSTPVVSQQWHVLPSSPDPCASHTQSQHYWSSSQTYQGSFEDVEVIASPISDTSSHDFSSCSTSRFSSPEMVPHAPIVPDPYILPTYPSQLPCAANGYYTTFESTVWDYSAYPNQFATM